MYKVEKYIDECINSLTKQTYKNIEIILVDDGSPDNCGSICDQYAVKDDRIKVLHQKNQGLSMARNNGFSISTGEYIVFIDSDDLIHEQYIEYLMNLVVESGSSMSVCQVGDFNDGRSPLYILDKSHKTFSKTEALTQFFYMNKMRTGVVGKLFCRSLIINNLFTPNIYYEDAGPMYNAICRSSSVCIGDALLFGYRHRESAQIKQKFTIKEMDCINEWEAIYKDVLQNLPELKKEVTCRTFSAYFHIYFMIPYNKHLDENNRIWSLMKKQRATVLFDSKARKKARLAALLSYSGNYLTKYIGAVLLKQHNKTIFKEQA